MFTIHCYIVIDYGAVENFKEENIRELVESTMFTEKTYTDWSFVPQMDTKLPNFAEWIATNLEIRESFSPQKFSAIYAVFKYVKSTFEESVAGVMVCNRLVGWLQFTVSWGKERSSKSLMCA